MFDAFDVFDLYDLFDVFHVFSLVPRQRFDATQKRAPGARAYHASWGRHYGQSHRCGARLLYHAAAAFHAPPAAQGLGQGRVERNGVFDVFDVFGVCHMFDMFGMIDVFDVIDMF